MADISIHPDAEAEYEQALAWYYRRSHQAAQRFETVVEEVIETIRAHPAMFPLIDDRHRFVLLRRYPYSVVYRLDHDHVRLIALAHAKRRPFYWLERE